MFQLTSCRFIRLAKRLSAGRWVGTTGDFLLCRAAKTLPVDLTGFLKRRIAWSAAGTTSSVSQLPENKDEVSPASPRRALCAAMVVRR